ncbi:methanogen output domain 1-containing protein [Fictibacillus phosphorivorans]|uniref:methanogen output domain 1-containing protein n=1 Tax=Fictibacillus phosphorivorans TaxID=1221500 RepID=UPI00203F3BFA|nr:methanogen output domain 1-containing protein [Fictibacillus phosphorivorans]MCM3718308.1 methanogen output domain 1-containing protein [Fictibacillus phosphorivorans]MCM3775828.1 methanogen output domain 1-containing protein [Fictibacillus phosphorivorans]
MRLSKGELNGHTFLAKLITQYAFIHKKTIGPAAEKYIEQLGLRTGEWIENFYEDPLHWTVEHYVHVIVDLKNSIGGHFEIVSVSSDHVVVRAKECPFGELVMDAPHLCKMTSSVFGGIAARNFGYGKVSLRKRIALGEPNCEIAIYFEPDEKEEGDIYQNISITPEHGDPFAWEEETITMLNYELKKSDEMVMSLLEELEELKSKRS